METMSTANLTKKAIGPLDTSRLNLSAVRGGRTQAKLQEDEKISLAEAESRAKDTYETLRKTGYVARKREFYNTLKDEAEAEGFSVSAAADGKIERILSDPRLKEDEGLRVGLWRELNTLCIDLDKDVPPEDKARFKQMVSEARNEDEVVDVDRKWMAWRIDKLGGECVSHIAEGYDCFVVLAEALKNKDEKCLNEDWYWAYLFHVVNQSAKIRVWAQMSLRKATRRR